MPTISGTPCELWETFVAQNKELVFIKLISRYQGKGLDGSFGINVGLSAGGFDAK
jgi:hypothetical protein